MKENDIRADKYAAKIKYYATEDKKVLMKREKDFVEVFCPACGKKDARFAFIKLKIQYWECDNCQTIYANPRPTFEILKEYYQKSKNYRFWNKYVFPASEKARREKIFKPRADMIIDYCKRFNIGSELIVEVGAGFGTFCEEIKSRNFFKRVIGIEPTPNLAATCRQKRVEIIEKPVEEIEFNDIKADVIASFETIEHLFCPRDFILSCGNLLKKRGMLILSCPNMFGFDTSILRGASKSVGGEHINMFNPASMKLLLRRCGFTAIDVTTPGELDVELARKSVIDGDLDVSSQPFLKRVLIDYWENVGENFQKFLANNLLSSHMLVAARKNKA